MAEKLNFILICVLAIVLTAASKDGNDFQERQLKIVERLQEVYRTNSTYAQLFDKTFNHTLEEHWNQFDCPIIAPSTSAPTSVNRLRPGDIKVIAALGDSITAGRGASGGIIGLLIDYRGLSWSGGGDGSYANTKTLANIFRQYNANLYGFATGTGNRDRSRSKFNVAKSGAKSDACLEQAKILHQRMKDDPNIDFENDWKLITLFIGGNDLCASCLDEVKYSVENYAQNVRLALDYMHDNIPRAFVNLVEVLNIEIVQELGQNLLCDIIHIYVCDCAANPSTEQGKRLLSLRESYQAAARDLVASGRYDDKEDFSVVLQPFYRETFLPRKADGEVDMSYFASDCFHYSKKGQDAVAAALWNNIFQPEESKRLNWTPGESLICPTEGKPYLYTAKNSV